MPYIGKRLKELRLEKNMTQKQLAEALQLSKSAIVQYEHNKREPNFESLHKIVSYFKVSAQYLSGTSEHKKLSEQLFYNNTIQNSKEFHDANQVTQRATISLVNHFNEQIINILAMDSQGKSEPVLRLLIDIFNRIWSISRSDSLKQLPEMYEGEKFSKLELYKLQEKDFQIIVSNIVKELKEIFDYMYDDIYEEYCKRYSLYARDNDYIEIIKEINEESDMYREIEKKTEDKNI